MTDPMKEEELDLHDLLHLLWLKILQPNRTGTEYPIDNHPTPPYVIFHISELLVLRYLRVMVIYPYPFWG